MPVRRSHSADRTVTRVRMLAGSGAGPGFEETARVCFDSSLMYAVTEHYL